MRRLLGLLPLLIALPLITSGCGADDVNPDALAQAAETTRAKGGVHITMEGTVESAGEKVPIEAEGDADLRNSRAHLKTQAGNGVPEFEQILIGTTMYVRGSATMPVEVWIDDDDLVRRQKMTTRLKVPAPMTSTIDIRFTDFGKPVRIQAPEGDVRDITDQALKQLEGAGAP